MRLLVSILTIVSSCALASAQATAPTTAPGQFTPQQEQALERLKLEADHAALPTRELKSIDEVIAFRREGAQLLVTPQLDRLDQETRLIVPGVNAFKKLRPFVLNTGLGQQERGFSFLMHDLSGPAPSHAITNVSYTAGKLMIARDHQHHDVVTSVQYIQDPIPSTPDPDSPTVTMYVSRHDENDATPDLQLKRTANSFDDLLIRYPQDVNTFFRPILREFKQEHAVFAPDKRIAWQVLGEDYIIEPAMLERVNKLVTRLDAENYEDRQAAMEGLREIGQPAAVILLRADRGAMSPEKQSSVDEFLGSFIQLTADEANAMRDDRTFLLDVMTSDDVELRKLAWERLKSITNTTIDFDPRGEDAERAAAIDHLRASIKK
jgi:hypothetical protein